MANHWTDSEVKAAVEDYFNMLRSELSGKKYIKKRHRLALMEQLNNRTDGSVELKHQNISAVLIEMGIPYIDGYKPRFNYQRSLLPAAVTSYLENNPNINALFRSASDAAAQVPSVDNILAAFVKPPVRNENPVPVVAETPAIYNPTGVNYLEREARNQSLGAAGEQFVLNFERARLIHFGRESLADRIEQVSETVGPAAGFDIRSFETSGADRLIEVKTTRYGENTPFFVTPNEMRFSQEHADCYSLYRVFRFRKSPLMFALPGHLEQRCRLEPSEFIAWPA